MATAFGREGREERRSRSQETHVIALNGPVATVLSRRLPLRRHRTPAGRAARRRRDGRRLPRHLGIPTVTVPMGTMTDTGMPVGLTFVGRAYDDNALLTLAAAFEKTGNRRTEPPRTPRLPAE